MFRTCAVLLVALLSWPSASAQELTTAKEYLERGISRVDDPLTRGKAVLDFSKAIELDPKSAVAYAWRARGHQLGGEKGKAASDVAQALELDPKCEVAYFARGALSYEAGDVEKAFADVKQAIELNAEFHPAHGLLGRLQIDQRKLSEALASFETALRTVGRTDGSAYYEYLLGRGEVRYLSGSYKQAELDLAKGLRAPVNARGKLLLAFTYEAQGRYQDAISQLDKIIRRDNGKSYDLFAHRGRVRRLSGDLAGALADYNTSVERAEKPIDKIDAYVQRGHFHFARNDWKAAEADLDQALKIPPRSEGNLLWRALLRSIRSDLPGAFEDHEAALVLNPKSIQPRLDRAFLNMYRGDIRAAEREYSEVMLDIPGGLPLYYDALCLMSSESQEAAYVSLTRAIESNSKEPVYHRAKAWLELEWGNLYLAEEGFTKAIELGGEPSFDYIQRALVRVGLKKLKEAQSDYDAALRLATPKKLDSAGFAKDLALLMKKPKTALDYTARGKTRWIYNNLNGAYFDMTTAIRLSPSNADAYYIRGMIIPSLLAQHYWEWALADFTKAAELSPQSTDVLVERADLKLRLRRPSEALEDFSKALELKADIPRALSGRASARRLTGDLKGALEDANRALKLDPAQALALRVRGLVKIATGGKRFAESDFREYLEIFPNARAELYAEIEALEAQLNKKP